MRRAMLKICMMTAAFLLLSGCFSTSTDELYAVPKASKEYQNLQSRINEVIGAGAEYAAPLTGSYTQPVQLIDLDGDGVQEAIAFFRMPTSATSTGKPLQIYIYRQLTDGDFAVQAVIKGDLNVINSIAYEDLGGDLGKEVVVSWQISNKVYQLMAYAVHGDQVEQILYAPYTDYAIWDLDKDNQKEIVVLDINTLDSRFQADLYDYDTSRGSMVLRDSAPMSKDIVGLADGARPRVGYLRDYQPAMFVTSSISTGVITDVFAWRNESFQNITLNPESGLSEGTYRLNNNVSIRDINSDSILELPRPTAFTNPRGTGVADNYWAIQWMQYDVQGTAWPVYNTYYNGEDGWYLVLPDAWGDKIGVDGAAKEKIILSRRDVVGSGERGVVFSLWTGDETADPEPFLTVYKLTGPNQDTRSKLGGRFVLLKASDATYAAEFTPEGWDCGLTEATLTESFYLIQADWPMGY